MGAKIDKDLAANMKDLKASLDKLQQEINAISTHPEPIIIEKVNSGANDPNEAALKKAEKKELSERQLAETVALKS